MALTTETTGTVGTQAPLILSVLNCESSAAATLIVKVEELKQDIAQRLFVAYPSHLRGSECPCHSFTYTIAHVLLLVHMANIGTVARVL